jgi:hypothetical protein
MPQMIHPLFVIIYSVNRQAKVVPVHAMKAFMGVEVQLHALLTAALQGEL